MPFAPDLWVIKKKPGVEWGGQEGMGWGGEDRGQQSMGFVSHAPLQLFLGLQLKLLQLKIEEQEKIAKSLFWGSVGL
jgi:hypothetical protein